MRSISAIILGTVFFMSCEIFETDFDNTLDLDNNSPPGLVFTPEVSNTSLGGSAAVSMYEL